MRVETIPLLLLLLLLLLLCLLSWHALQHSLQLTVDSETTRCSKSPGCACRCGVRNAPRLSMAAAAAAAAAARPSMHCNTCNT
jgi:hypothetical protein